jgi:hypothetical protein
MHYIGIKEYYMYAVKKQTIYWNPPSCSPFMQSLKEVIPICCVSLDSCYIPSNKIKPLTKDSLNYDLMVKLAECISTQLMYLERRGLTLTGYDLTDILSVDDGRYFIAANYERIVPHTNQMIRFTVPFYKPSFTCLTENRLPIMASYLTARISLGLLFLHLLDGDINKIRYTKLYWFINRCLKTPDIGFTLVNF